MRIVIITQGVSPIVKNLLSSKHKIIGIIEDRQRIAPSKTENIISLYLDRLIHFNDHKFKRLENFCKSNGLSYQFFDKSSEARIENWLDWIKPEIIVVYSMSHLLSNRIFSKPKYGAINLHPSLLPSYRGPNPYFWMYYYMEEKGGVTVHHLDENEDTGDIVFQQEYYIQPGSTYPELFNKSVEIGASLLQRSLDALENGQAPRIRQPRLSPTPRARNLDKEDYPKIINLENWEVKRVWHLLRGFPEILEYIRSPANIEKSQIFDVNGYDITDIQNYIIGKIYKLRGNNYFLVCSNGIIYLTLKYNSSIINKYILKNSRIFNELLSVWEC